MLARDNLRIKTLAKYKSLRDGDIQMYQDIENQMVDLAMCKGKAFDDSSMEEKEREIESDLDHRGLNTQDNHFGRQSENSERLLSVASEDDYWQTLVDKRKNHLDRQRTTMARQNVNKVALK